MTDANLYIQWYPIGGFHKVVQSLVDIAKSHGARYSFSTPVSAVTYDHSGRATGVRLSNGEWKGADAVVVNADLVWAYNNLFTKDDPTSDMSRKGASVTEGGNARETSELLDPKFARRLLDKPHS